MENQVKTTRNAKPLTLRRPGIKVAYYEIFRTKFES